jgi:hypothetical protein
MNRRFQVLCLTAQIGALCAGGAWAQQPSEEEIWRIIQQQQREIEELKSRQSEADKKIEAAGDQIEAATKAPGGMVEGWWNKTSIGGYGELHYNGGNADQIDFHRFVLFFAHQFNDRIRFFSEVELEHVVASSEDPGEVELEQAYVEFKLNDRLSAKAGLFLVPVGILNETHEPPTFFGVERNIVETNIVPSTWWEGGVSGHADLGGGFSADLAAHSGLSVETSGAGAFLVRGGRRQVAEAPAEDPAVTGRVKWTGMPGVELAATAQYQDDVTQNALGIHATLFETHAAIRRGPWWLRALYAQWHLSGDEPAAVGRDKQWGWYVEPAYIFTTGKGDLGVFARYSETDNTAGDSIDSKIRQTEVGVNYWPHPQVVFKVDYQLVDAPPGQIGDDRINLAVGYMF